MGMVVTTCPVTRKEIPTGIETDAQTFARIASLIGRVWCPFCNADHHWSAESARLRADEPPSAR
jgi:hypothetical protein